MVKLIEYFRSITEGLEIIEDDDQAYGDTIKKANIGGYGSELLVVSEEDVLALLEGKAWMFPVNDGEYTHAVVMRKEDRK